MARAWRLWEEETLLSPGTMKRGYFETYALRPSIWKEIGSRRLRCGSCLELWHREFLH
jgi:hypothetical protein